MSPSPEREGRLLPVYTKPNKEKRKEKKLSQELNIPTLAQNVGYCGPEPSVVLLPMIKFCWENFISVGEVLEGHEDLVLVRWERGRFLNPSGENIGVAMMTANRCRS